MRLPMTLLAGASLIAGPAMGQPAKRDVPKVSPTAKHAEVVLASADTAHPTTPALGQPSTEPKRPAPRITHCRCGDPQPGDETPEQ